MAESTSRAVGRKTASGTIGLALGSGSSRGWSHIGIIRALADIGIEPDIICGCSVGAVVGASYVAGNMDALEEWVYSLTRKDVARFLDLNLSLNGFVDASRLQDFLGSHVCAEDITIEELARPFATVSTDLQTGREVWFTSGPVLSAVWASMSLPGLFPPIQNDGRWLVDGGLVNPVPVSVCRALGAETVIAVNLNGDIVGKHMHRYKGKKSSAAPDNSIMSVFKKTVKNYSPGFFQNGDKADVPPGLVEALYSAIGITQDRITRSRMAGDPPDILLVPRLANIGLLELYRGKEAISEGRDCVNRMLPEIEHVLRMT
ncbi:MAG: patatin-like phospholipase family protein [Gammaproteobacteria bacterium]